MSSHSNERQAKFLRKIFCLNLAFVTLEKQRSALTLSKLWNIVQERFRISMMRLPMLMTQPTEANPTMTYLRK